MVAIPRSACPVNPFILEGAPTAGKGRWLGVVSFAVSQPRAEARQSGARTRQRETAGRCGAIGPEGTSVLTLSAALIPILRTGLLQSRRASWICRTARQRPIPGNQSRSLQCWRVSPVRELTAADLLADPDLTEVVARWPAIPPPILAAIVAMVKATDQAGEVQEPTPVVGTRGWRLVVTAGFPFAWRAVCHWPDGEARKNPPRLAAECRLRGPKGLRRAGMAWISSRGPRTRGRSSG
jgi:hypothetical protein